MPRYGELQGRAPGNAVRLESTTSLGVNRPPKRYPNPSRPDRRTPKAPHRSKGKGRDAKRSSNGLSFHALRHTAVSLLKDAGIPEAVVMELVAQDSKAMSAHDTHVGTEALAKAVAALTEI